jgi:DNA-binding PadR family transcriptional regulator
MRQDLPTTAYALLGLLTFGQELTAYQLKQWADASLRFFWVAPAMSHVYREVGRLEEQGLIAGRDVDDGGRVIRTYRLTDAGRAALSGWLENAPVEFPVLKHSVALRLFESYSHAHCWRGRHFTDLVRRGGTGSVVGWFEG